MVALALGAPRVRAVDVDPEAIAVTLENARRNGYDDRIHANSVPAGNVVETFDVVLANIEARIVRRDQSLDDPAFAGADESRVSRLADDGVGPEREVMERQMSDLSRRRVRNALAGLDPRERAIIERRYLDGKGTTLKELGKSFGISRERVRQLEARAKQKMRAELADMWAA